MPRKLLVGGVQRTGSVKGVVKKVSPPTVPAVKFKKSPCICNGDEPLTVDFFDAENDYSSYSKPPRSPPNGNNNCNSFYPSLSNQSNSMKKMTPGDGSNGQIHLAHVIVHSQPDSLPSTPSDAGHSPYLSKGRLMGGTQVSLEDQGIDMNSPGRHSPGGSSGGSSISRHSLSSLDSGRASAPGSEGKAVNRRLSIQSYEGSSPQRRSYHSSSSSIASVGDDLGPGPNVAEMVLHGLPDVEVLSSWLATLHFEEYIPYFLLAGYDMPTITRMTPEDLTAIGITKPNHRRKLKAEIAKLNISDGIPEYKPDSLLEWLQLLRLEEYYDTLSQQNYNTIDKVTDLTWEDLEDIGIQKLGHQKRILLAIKRIEDINHGRRPNLYPQSSMHRHSGPGGSSTFPRPSTLSNNVPPHYPSQEIAISTHRPKSSPSTDSIPEMKTFQQSPMREDNLFLQAVHNSAQNLTSCQNHNGISNTVVSPTRVRSLESLNPESVITNINSIQPATKHYLQQEPPPPKSYTPLNQLPIDTSSQLPPTKSYTPLQQQPTKSYTPLQQQQPSEPSTQPPQPKSYTPLQQQPSTQPTTMSYTPLQQQPSEPSTLQTPPTKSSEPEAAEPKDWRVTDLDQEFEGTATLNRPKGLVRLRPMPKIAAKTREEIAEAIMDIPDSEFKSLISSGGGTLDGWSSLDSSPRHGSTVPRSATLKRAPPPPPPKRSNPPPPPKDNKEEDFPPPPAPLSSDEKDELFSNPLFRQRRKDSSESADAAALPFANETVGTIKQKAARPYPAIPAHSSTASSQQRSMQKSKNSQENSQSVQHEYDVSEAISPGDVIDDIENMLANLSDQLDAMLDEEVQK